MTPADVEDTGPFTVRDNETGRIVGLYHSLEAAHQMSSIFCDRFERSMTVLNRDGQVVGTAESYRDLR